ncbi:MAG: class I SAM-dependent methyltransferase [Chloroflexota bacterium]|nr:class I SAM-dependent methyltransferase [Candidatus Sulfotelmatobacter sp.]
MRGTNKTSLDVGCAFGYGVHLMHQLGYDAWGVDISRHALVQGRKRLTDNVFVVCDSQKSLPFNEKFNLVTCFEVLEHLRNPENALQNMYNVSDSVILCTTPNKTIEKIMKKILRRYDRTHVNVKTPAEWESLIRKTLPCKFMKIECFMDSSFQFVNTSFYKSLRLPFGMETRIIIVK